MSLAGPHEPPGEVLGPVIREPASKPADPSQTWHKVPGRPFEVNGLGQLRTNLPIPAGAS